MANSMVQINWHGYMPLGSFIVIKNWCNMQTGLSNTNSGAEAYFAYYSNYNFYVTTQLSFLATLNLPNLSLPNKWNDLVCHVPTRPTILTKFPKHYEVWRKFQEYPLNGSYLTANEMKWNEDPSNKWNDLVCHDPTLPLSDGSLTAWKPDHYMQSTS